MADAENMLRATFNRFGKISCVSVHERQCPATLMRSSILAEAQIYSVPSLRFSRYCFVTFEEFCNAARCLYECKKARINGRIVDVKPARARLVARPAGNSRPAKDSKELTAYIGRALCQEDLLQLINAHIQLMDAVAAATACFTLGKLSPVDEDGPIGIRASVANAAVLGDVRFGQLLACVEQRLPDMRHQVHMSQITVRTQAGSHTHTRMHGTQARVVCQTGGGELHAWPRKDRSPILRAAPGCFCLRDLSSR